MDSLALLERLSNAVGPSGFEDEVREIVLEVVRPLADDVRVDAVGNVIATRRGRRDDAVMLAGHMDEIGFLINYIEADGFLRILPIGGWDARVLMSHAVTVVGRDGRRARGVIGSNPPHILSEADRKKPVAIEDLFVDIGASSAAAVDAMGIEVGSICVPSYPFERIGDDLVMGKAFDDRAGCTVVAGALEALQGADLDLTVAFAFTVGEEVGLRGARVAANQIGAKVGLALEGTTATDVPGVSGPKRLARFGAGASVTIADASMLASRAVVGLLEQLAQKENIPYQRKVPGGGGTDAAAIQQSGAGALCGVVSVPCRYIHTPLTLLRPSDLDAAIRLTTAFAREAGSLI